MSAPEQPIESYLDALYGLLSEREPTAARRLLAGGLGLALLTVWLLWRRGAAGRLAAALPPILVPAVGFTAFTIAAVGLSAQAADTALTYGGDGVGFYLSGAVAAALGGLAFAVPMIRRVITAST